MKWFTNFSENPARTFQHYYTLAKDFPFHLKETALNPTNFLAHRATHFLSVSESNIELRQIRQKANRQHYFPHASSKHYLLNKQHDGHSSDVSIWLHPPSGADAHKEPARSVLHNELSDIFEQADCHYQSLTLIIDSQPISMRHLMLPSTNPKQIDQILPYSLEGELLAPVTDFMYAFDLAETEDGQGEVGVYLVSKDVLQPLIHACESSQNSIIKATFSAYALFQNNPVPASGTHFQVYVGGDEVFVNHIINGKLERIKAIPVDFSGWVAEVKRRANNQDAEGQMLSEQHYWEQWREETLDGNTLDNVLLTGLETLINQSADELNRVVQVYHRSDCSLSLYGIFSNCLTWDAPSIQLVPASQVVEKLPAILPKCWGIISALDSDAPALNTSLGFSLYTSKRSWMSRTRLYKRSLVVLVSLVYALVMWMGWWTWEQGNLLEERGVKNTQQLKSLLNITGSSKNPAVLQAAMSKLKASTNQLMSQQENLNPFLQNRFAMTSMLVDINKKATETTDITLESIDIGESRLLITGFTKTYKNITEFRKKLLEIPILTNGKGTITQNREKERIKYKIIIEDIGIVDAVTKK